MLLHLRSQKKFIQSHNLIRNPKSLTQFCDIDAYESQMKSLLLHFIHVFFFYFTNPSVKAFSLIDTNMWKESLLSCFIQIEWIRDTWKREQKTGAGAGGRKYWGWAGRHCDALAQGAKRQVQIKLYFSDWNEVPYLCSSLSLAGCSLSWRQHTR